jgi:hypothetical protein
MHIRKYIRKIVDEGSPEEMQKLSDILVNLIEYAEETNDDVYRKNAICIYKMANSNKIDRDLAEEIVNDMRPYGERWTFDDIEKIKRDYNMDDMRAEDIYLVMNQGFNDYRDTLFGDDLSNYIKYTKAFINDPDAKKDKIINYFL